MMIILDFQQPLVPSLAALLCSQKNAVEEVKEVDGLFRMELVCGHGAHEVQGALTSSISCIAFGGMP